MAKYLFFLDDDVIHPFWGVGFIYSCNNTRSIGRVLFDDHLEKGAISVYLPCLELLYRACEDDLYA